MPASCGHDRAAAAAEDRIVLEAAEGHATREIARWFETTPTTVSLLARPFCP